MDSNPVYQWQPFVQTPYINPDENLDLEEGETIYEDKWAQEWVIFWKLAAVFPVVFLYLLVTQWFDNNLSSSISYLRQFGLMLPSEINVHKLTQETNRFDVYKNWGKGLIHWEHWIERLIGYPTALLFVIITSLGVSRIGKEVVYKAVYNRSKDLVFIYRSGPLGEAKCHISELHFLEKSNSPLIASWKYYGFLNGNKHSSSPIVDLNSNELFTFKSHPDFWNHNLKSHFDENTETYWRGLKSKDVNRGLTFNNSFELSNEEAPLYNRVEEELRDAIVKHGPLQKHDYDHSIRYSLRKRLADNRMKLLNGAAI